MHLPGDSDPTDTTRSTAVSSSAIVFPIFALLSCILCIPPLISHISARNLAATVLVAGFVISNTQNFINALIWPSYPLEARWNGQGLCDVEVKLYIGIGQAIVGATASIFRQLASILDTENAAIIPSKSQKRKTLLFEIGLCLILPIYAMAAHYLVQTSRYALAAISGCVYTYHPSWVSYVLITMWPVLIGLVAIVYCLIAMFRLIRYRQTVSILLANSSTISKARYFRLLGLACVLLLFYIPLAVYSLIYALTHTQFPYSWTDVHGAGWSHRILILTEAEEMRREHLRVDRWCHIATGLILFALFGLGNEAIAMYRSWAEKLRFSWWRSSVTRCQSSVSGESRLPFSAELPTSNSLRATRALIIRDAVDMELARIDQDLDLSRCEEGSQAKLILDQPAKTRIDFN